MITADFVRLMARYCAWQNEGLITAAATLDDAARAADRGAFFGSITGTLNHLRWGDRIWLSRFAGTVAPTAGSISESVTETADWLAYVDSRRATDADMQTWAASLTDDRIAGDLTWKSGAAGRQVTRPLAGLIVHAFNHGTHHRGQVHAMLTAAGARPGDTDLFLMPDEA